MLASALIFAGYLVAQRAIAAARRTARSEPDPVAAQFVYAAPTANDAMITLPPTVQNKLVQIGLEHRSIALTRVDSDGNVSTSVIDMTPRTGNSPNDPPLIVNGRAVPVIDKKISAIQKIMNTPSPGGHSQDLYAGLTKVNFTGAPVTIISTGLDVANPDNFRSLDWSVPPAQLVAVVKGAHALPALHGPVTFVTVPTAGPQPQLDQHQKNYRHAVWTALLEAGGATSVTFTDADGTTAPAGAPNAPIVPVGALPGTPKVTPVPTGHNTVKCTLPASYFVFGTAKLVDAGQTKQALTRCITQALADHATFALDGWASYQGPLNASGQPEFDYGYNRKLSKARVQAIARLLVNDLKVAPSAITRMSWHGNLDQPDPGDPGSPANQVVIITYTTK